MLLKIPLNDHTLCGVPRKTSCSIFEGSEIAYAFAMPISEPQYMHSTERKAAACLDFGDVPACQGHHGISAGRAESLI